MGVEAGPNIVNSGLVLSYDGANVRSFRGEPTTNLVNPSWSGWSVDGSGQGAIGTRTILSSYHCKIEDVVANTRQYRYIESGISGSTVYTFSIKYKKIAGAPTLRFQIQSYTGGTFLGAAFPTTQQLGVQDTTEWQTITYNYTTNSGANRILWFVQDGDDYTTYTHAFELKEAQVEQRSTATSFVDGTRGTTNATGGGWVDLSGNNKHGALTNGPTYNSDNGGSIVFDGTNDYIDLGNLGTIGNYQTIDVWFYSTSVTNYKNVLDMNYGNYVNTGNVGPRLEQSTGGSTGWLWSGNTTTNNSYHYQSNTYGISANTWYNATWVNNNGTVAIYLNGVATETGISSAAHGFLTTYGAASIGRGFHLDSSRYFAGRVPALKVYNVALTAAQVAQNFNATRARFGV